MDSLALALKVVACFIQGYYRRGAAYLAMGKFKEALKDFQQVVLFTQLLQFYYVLILFGLFACSVCHFVPSIFFNYFILFYVWYTFWLYLLLDHLLHGLDFKFSIS